MKILSRRTGPARNEDVNGDGVVDARDRTAVADRADARPEVTDRDEERTGYRNTATDGERRADRATADGALATKARRTGTTVDPEPSLERTVDLDRDGRPDRPLADADGRTAPVALGPKPRASLLATLGLIVSVVGALFVLSGALAGYGIGLAAVGAVLAVLGLVATRRRHVAGTTDALIGVLVGLAAVVLGIVAMTGQFDWPTTDGEWVGRFREWLDSQFAATF
ncbi:DMT family transporter [Micromonospora sp. NPDC047738]|uniref:DMT family transporter n=1 Tax=unclassified Micromonospora TaxID=2617518 RepID=UPI0033DEC89B